MHPHRRSTPRRSSSLGLLQRSPRLFPLPRHAQLRHRQQIEHGFEVLALEHALLHHELSHRDVLRTRSLGELRSLGVSDPGREGGDEGGVALEPVLALGAVGFDALDASLREHPGGVRENLHREQKIVCDDGHHDIELELSRLHRGGGGGGTARAQCHDARHRTQSSVHDADSHERLPGVRGAMRRGHRSRPRPVRVLARAQPRPRHRPRSQDRIRRGCEARQGSGGEERHGATTRDGEGRAQGQGPRSRARSAGDDGVGRAWGAEITEDFVGGAPMNWIVAGLIAGVGAFFADYVMWGKVFTGPEMHGFGTMPPTPEAQKKLMASNMPKAAALALIFGLLLACSYQRLKGGLWVQGGGPLAGMEFATLLWLCTIALSTLGSGVWYDKVRPLLKATFWSWLVRMNVAGLIVGLLVK